MLPAAGALGSMCLTPWLLHVIVEVQPEEPGAAIGAPRL